MKIVRVLTAAGDQILGKQHEDGAFTALTGEFFGTLEETSEKVVPIKLLAPLEPVDIICIGLNYRQHAEETGAALPENPVVFMKSTGALQNPGDPIELPRTLRSDRVDFECELVVIIGKECKNATADNALEYVLGYTCGNDVSARDWQKQGGGGQWCRGKTFDTFAPLGPCLVTADEIADPNSLAIKTTLNDQVMQESNTADMIFNVPKLIEFLSGSTTLRPGTAIFTGTPQGVGFARKPPVYLQPGDEVSIEIENIGVLTNPVIEEPS